MDRLGDAKYVLLTTFRKDGTPVPTPVWVAADGDRLVVWSSATAGKVQRIRRSGQVRVRPCTFRGRPLGPEVPGQAELLAGGAADYARDLVRHKYGITGALTMLASTLRHGREGTVCIGITVHAS